MHDLGIAAGLIDRAPPIADTIIRVVSHLHCMFESALIEEMKIIKFAIILSFFSLITGCETMHQWTKCLPTNPSFPLCGL
jgi:hypothetical protein